MSSTKNVGQVVGLYIGTSAPTNTKLIWFDTTTNQQCHKVYDPVTRTWKALNPEIVSNTTYSELVSNAQRNGLSVGKFYQITDKSNTLAIAITTTKVQYSDSLGNFLIDDLGSNIQYHVSSGNLLIDDLNGVFNTDTNKLVFQFSEQTPNVDTDYVFGKSRIGNAWRLAKYKLSSFLSSAAGNSLTWNGGLFFNFTEALRALINKVGGVVGYDSYINDFKTLTNNINNVAKENQTIISNAAQDTTNKTTDEAIFNKRLPQTLDVGTAAGDVLVNDTLLTIVSKFQRWINQFKYATGIRLSNSFRDASQQEYVNNNDTVETAFGKVQYMLKHPTTVGKLPEDWTTNAPRGDGQPTNGTYDAFEQDGYPVAGDTIFYAFAKIVAFIQKVGTYGELSESWKEADYTGTVANIAAGDSLDTAFAKAAAKLRQLGIITNGRLTSRVSNVNGQTTDFNIQSGTLRFNGATSYSQLSASGLNIDLGDSQGGSTVLSLGVNSFNYYSSNNHGGLHNGVYSSVYFESRGNSLMEMAALQAYATQNNANTYDAFFNRLKVGILTYGAVFVSSVSYSITTQSLVVYNAAQNGDIYLPANPASGRFVMIAISSSNSTINVHAQGGAEIDTINESAESVTINERGSVFAFFYISGIYYGSAGSVTGLWQYAKWSRTNR
jgi:hypothetical protein